MNGADHNRLIDCTDWHTRWSPASWREALNHGIQDAALLDRIRESTRTGRPVGGQAFLQKAEALAGRPLAPLKRGPKIRQAAVTAQLELGVS